MPKVSDVFIEMRHLRSTTLQIATKRGKARAKRRHARCGDCEGALGSWPKGGARSAAGSSGPGSDCKWDTFWRTDGWRKIARWWASILRRQR